MEKFAIFCFVLVAVHVAFSNVQSLPQDHRVVHEEDLEYLHDREFRLWLFEYYEGGREHWAEIYPTWKKNAEFVKEHNSLGHLSYKLSLNKFAHLNISDIVKPECYAPHHELKQVQFEKHAIPPMVDWRKKRFISSVKDHTELNDSHFLYPILDSINAMWAISHDHLDLASFERPSVRLDSINAVPWWGISHNHLDLASFEEFKDCCWKEGELHQWNLSHYECVLHLGGLAREEDYKSPHHTCLSSNFPSFVKISGASYVKPKDEKALALAVTMQPIAVAVDASHKSFQFYKEGIYYEPHCSSEELNHAMLLVGYGVKNGKDYWILKNSWGESWGMDGYMLMAKDMENHCGIASKAMYPF